MHAKELSPEPLFTNQVGFAALKHSQAKAQLPSNPLQCPSPCPHHRHPSVETHKPLLEAFILSLILSLLFARICSKLSRLRAFYVNYVAQKCEAMVTSQIHILKKKNTSNRFKCLNSKIEGMAVLLLWHSRGGTLGSFFLTNTEYKPFCLSKKILNKLKN